MDFYLEEKETYIPLRTDLDTALFLLHFASNLCIQYRKHENEIRATWYELTPEYAAFIEKQLKRMKLEINQVKYN
jgi:hypothetical protein